MDTTEEIDLREKVSLYGALNSKLLNLCHTIAHNLNSYTGNIKLFVDVIDKQDEDSIMDSKLAIHYLHCVLNDLDKTLANLFQIVGVQNTIDVEKQSLNLNEYLTKVVNVINGYGNENNATIINNVPEDAFVVFNPAYLESILLNFSTNAIKYAHPGRFPIIEFNFFIEEGKKALSITDNGLGIDLERYEDSLFELYKTFHLHENAHGFGLYITKHQIESMKGKVSVKSKVDKGTTFKIHFND